MGETGASQLSLTNADAGFHCPFDDMERVNTVFAVGGGGNSFMYSVIHFVSSSVTALMEESCSGVSCL